MWLAAGIIVVSAFLAYSNTFFGLRLMDDSLATSTNRSIQHLWPLGPVLSPPSTVPEVGRPLLNLSFAINYAISKQGVVGYHVFNLAVHMLAGLVVLGTVRRMLLLPILRGRFGEDALSLAFAVALLWVLHPVQTESVAYISQRAESMMGLFYLLTIYSLIRVSQSETPRARARWVAVCITSCALGMMTKEVMITAPVMALIFDRVFLAGSWREAWNRRKWLYVGLGASWLNTVYSMADVHQHGVGFGLGVSTWQYALTECKAVFHYLVVTIWPHPLVVDFGTDLVKDPLQVLPQALVLAGLLALTVVMFIRRPLFGFAGIWFFLILTPTSSFVPIIGAPIGEHRVYLSLLSVMTLIVLGLYCWLGRNSRFVVLVVAAVFGVVTYERNFVYQSPTAFAEDDLSKVPENERMLTAMGGCFVEMGRYDDAMAEYRHALSINPDDPLGHNGMASALSHLGRNEEAAAEFREAIRLDPTYSDAYYNLGETLAQLGQMKEAVETYQKAIEIDPDTSRYHYNLGRALARMDQPANAMVQFQLALQLDPDDVDAAIYLGGMFAQQAHYQEAIICFNHALQLDPGNVEAHNDYGITLALLGQKDDAATQFREALRLDPNYNKAQKNLEELNKQHPRPAGK